ncbi:MAG: hypothetical protein ABH983_01645 [Candidatus Micrarchaeota archaeon]
MYKKLATFALFLLLLANAAYALEDSVSKVEQVWGLGWGLASIIAITIMVSFSALVYMFSSVTSNIQLKVWATSELYQAFVSVLIISILFVGMAQMDILVQSFIHLASDGQYVCPEPLYACHITIAQDYMESAKGAAYSVSQGLINQAVADASAAMRGTGWNYNDIPWIGQSDRPNAGRYMNYERSALLLEGLTNVMGLMEAQSQFLDSIKNYITPMLIVYGILLRSFFMTRKVGGLMIAVGLGVFYAYPLMYVLFTFTLGLQATDQAPVVYACPDDCKTYGAHWIDEITDDTEYCNQESVCGYARIEINDPNDPSDDELQVSDNLYCPAECRVTNFNDAAPQICIDSEEIRTRCTQPSLGVYSTDPDDTGPLLPVLMSPGYNCDDSCKVEIKTSGTSPLPLEEDCSICARKDTASTAPSFDPTLPGTIAEGNDAAAVGKLTAVASVLPLLGILLTMAFIRRFSPLLGGDIEITGLAKII